MKNSEILTAELPPSEKKAGKKPETAEIIMPLTAESKTHTEAEKSGTLTSTSPASINETIQPIQAPSSLSSLSDSSLPTALPMAPSLSHPSSSTTSPGISHSGPSDAPQQQIRVVEMIAQQIPHNRAISDHSSVRQIIVTDPPAESSLANSGNSPPPVWLDGAIGLVLVAIASLLCRKVL